MTELSAIDEDVANRYLEHVVVIKRSPNRMLHQALLDHLLESVSKEVQDDGVKYHLEELGELGIAERAFSSWQMRNIACRPTRSPLSSF